MKTKKPSKLLLRKNQNMIKIENNATEIFEEKKNKSSSFFEKQNEKIETYKK